VDPAPLDPVTLAGALAFTGSATMLPALAYTSPAVLAWERRHLFAATWSCAGREQDLRAPAPARPDGSVKPVMQRGIRVGDVGVLLTWGDDATAERPSGASSRPTSEPDSQTHLRAFANTCRHRGHELLPEGASSERRSVVCPYHAWSYDLSGAVRATPGIAGPPGDELDLVELPVARWGGWVFVHAATPIDDPTVPPFDEHLGALDRIVSPYGTERLVRRARHTYEVAANWKVLTENYHECYHCPLIHPELCRVSPPDSGDNYDLPGAWVGGAMTLRDGAQTMSLTGQSAGRPLPGVDPTRVEYLALFPDLLLSLHPDYVMSHRLVPLGPDRTWVECSWYFDPEPVDGADVDPSYAVEFWDVTNRQDWAACESVQRGLSSPHFRPGPFATNEDAVHRFVGMVARAYLGRPPSGEVSASMSIPGPPDRRVGRARRPAGP
jgi:Rieske 2Fe-2S family protein